MAATMPCRRASTRLRSVSFHFRDGHDGAEHLVDAAFQLLPERLRDHFL
jgi:hypothetical protein